MLAGGRFHVDQSGRGDKYSIVHNYLANPVGLSPGAPSCSNKEPEVKNVRGGMLLTLFENELRILDLHDPVEQFPQIMVLARRIQCTGRSQPTADRNFSRLILDH